MHSLTGCLPFRLKIGNPIFPYLLIENENEFPWGIEGFRRGVPDIKNREKKSGKNIKNRMKKISRFFDLKWPIQLWET